jgi:hypothetical protein
MEVMNLSIQTHIFAIIALISLIVFNLYRLFRNPDFLKVASTYKKMTPFFHFVNATVAYTGMIVAAFTHDLSITVIMMIGTTLFVMISEIKRYKKMRVIKLEDSQLQKEFILFAKKISLIQLGLLMSTFIISKLF